MEKEFILHAAKLVFVVTLLTGFLTIQTHFNAGTPQPIFNLAEMQPLIIINQPLKLTPIPKPEPVSQSLPSVSTPTPPPIESVAAATQTDTYSTDLVKVSPELMESINQMDQMDQEKFSEDEAMIKRELLSSNDTDVEPMMVNQSVTLTAADVVTPPQPETINVSAPKKSPAKLWIIQLGSFKNKVNAESLEARVKAAGYKAFTRNVISAHGTRTVVFVGPPVPKPVMTAAVAKKLKQMKLENVVVHFVG